MFLLFHAPLSTVYSLRLSFFFFFLLINLILVQYLMRLWLHRKFQIYIFNIYFRKMGISHIRKLLTNIKLYTVFINEFSFCSFFLSFVFSLNNNGLITKMQCLCLHEIGKKKVTSGNKKKSLILTKDNIYFVFLFNTFLLMIVFLNWTV